MKVVVSEKSPVERILEVSIEADRVTQAFDKCLNEVVRALTIPGFRKGKAPRRIAERHANQEQLRRSVFEDVGVPAYERALADEKLTPVGPPDVELVTMESGKDMVFRATIEIRPVVEIERSEYEGLEVEVEHVAVEEADIDRVLQDLRRRHERTVAVEDGHELAMGEIAVVDFTSTVDGEPVDNGSAEDFQMDLDHRSFPAGFAENLVGMTAGQQKTFEFSFPEEYENKALAGKTARFDFSLKGIKKRELPELDDDLAAEASQFSTLTELRADIQDRLEKTLRAEIGNRAVEKLARTKEIPVPRAFVSQMVRFLINNQARQFAQLGLRLEDILKARNLTVEQAAMGLVPQAEQLAKAELICDALIEAEGIQLTDADLEAEMRRYAELTGQEFEVVQKALKEHNEMEAFRRDSLRRRVVDMLGGLVNAVPKPAEAEAGPEATPSAIEAPAESAPESPAVIRDNE